MKSRVNKNQNLYNKTQTEITEGNKSLNSQEELLKNAHIDDFLKEIKEYNLKHGYQNNDDTSLDILQSYTHKTTTNSKRINKRINHQLESENIDELAKENPFTLDNESLFENHDQVSFEAEQELLEKFDPIAETNKIKVKKVIEKTEEKEIINKAKSNLGFNLILSFLIILLILLFVFIVFILYQNLFA